MKERLTGSRCILIQRFGGIAVAALCRLWVMNFYTFPARRSPT